MTVLLFGLLAWLACIMYYLCISLFLTSCLSLGARDLKREEALELQAKEEGVQSSRELALLENEHKSHAQSARVSVVKRGSTMKIEIVDESAINADVAMRITQERLSLMGHL
jgi:hypothetical protein